MRAFSPNNVDIHRKNMGTRSEYNFPINDYPKKM